jgi:hypothetical protein
MKHTAGSVASHNQEIRCIIEDRSKVSTLVKLFGYDHFEDSTPFLSPKFFNKGARVYSSVSAVFLYSGKSANGGHR